VIGRFFRKLFGGGSTPPAPTLVPARAVVNITPVVVDVAVAVEAPVSALAPEEIEDRFYRLVLGLSPSDDAAFSPTEQSVLRRVREAFGGERFDVGSLPRLPSVVPQLMRSLRNDDSDSRALAELIGRDAVLVGEIVRVANSAFFKTSRPVTSLPQAITLLGQDGLRRVVMQLVMRPILRTNMGGASQHAGERLWEHAERCARACIYLGRNVCDPFEAFLAGLISQTGAQTILLELEEQNDTRATALSRPLVAALAQQIERLSLHAARHWAFPSRVVQALAERADPADAGARTPLGRALLSASRVAMLDVLIEQGLADPDSALLASPGQTFTQAQLIACRDALRTAAPAEA
jgi:HD-like signal output (HDOD) protein